MSNVYFKRLDVLDDSVNDVVYDMLKKIIEDESITLAKTVPMKVHFGERGNETFIKPNYFNGIKKYLKDNDIETKYIETNVLYKGSRTETSDHIKTALEHGFDDLELVIADDLDNYDEIEVNLKNFKSCKIGSLFNKYQNFIVVSHFKGHGMAGFGGAIKQLAMGFASRGGKLHQHSNSVPLISDECICCGACVVKCPVNAISIEDKAVIDKDICIGCASCTPICPVSAISNSWQVSNFHEKIAEYAYAASRNKKNIYIQYAFNITPECDCHGSKQEIIAPNIGVLVSTDPVAIDQASYDLLNKVCTTHNFNTAELTLKHASDIKLGNREYNLKEI